ncbi:hypothetical protein HY634_04245, partial [Candidatus Uhrbacteria bacterium]|nr:hypothetical protein [Candidatus Uhrbacteria bacterium]
MLYLRTHVIPTTAAILIAAVLLVFVRVDAATLPFTEDFSTTTRRDTTTTAVWDTTDRAVRLPSGSASWQAMGDVDGMSITAVAFSPGFASDHTVLVGSADGIFRSQDDGVSWSRVATTAQPVMRIALSPAFASDRTGFAITNGSGIWRTTDGGASWTKISGTSGFGIAVSPSYASDQTVFAATFASVQKSTDGGGTWADASTGIDTAVLDNGDLRGIAVARSYGTDRTVFVSSLGSGVYRSTDGGGQWAQANPSDVSVPYATVIATGANGTVVAAFLDSVYRSGDNGTTWTKISSSEVNDVTFAPNGAVLMATTTGASRWQGSSSGIAAGWPGGAAKSIGVASTYPASGSVIAGRSNGASRTSVGYQQSAVAVSKVVDATSYRITRATVTPTAVIPTNTTITYHVSVKDGAAVWEGPLAAGTAWTFKEVGSSLRWRATLATSESTVTPTLSKMDIAYEADDALPAPTPTGHQASVTSMRWNFSDAAADETGFEIHAGKHGTADERVVVTTKPKDAKNFTFLSEGGLTPNTEYCDRHAHTLRGDEVSPPSTVFGCAVTLASVPPTPTAGSVTDTAVALTFAHGQQNPDDTEYAMRDAKSGKYVGEGMVFGGSSPWWRTRSQWGDGALTVQSLIPDTAYAFCVVARNRKKVETVCSGSVDVTTEPMTRPPEPPPPPPPVNTPVEPPPVVIIGAPPEPPTNTAGGSPPEPPPVNTGAGSGDGMPTENGGTTSPVSTGGSSGSSPTLALLAPTQGTATSAPSLVVDGVLSAAATPITLSVDGAVVGTATSGPDGRFTYVIVQTLPEGAHTIVANATVQTVPLTSSAQVIVDRTPPLPPTVASARAVERVESATTADAFDVTFEVHGTLTPPELAELDALLVTVASDPVTFTFRPTSSEWSYRNTLPLSPGSHSIRVAARDRAGNVSSLPPAIALVIPPAACGDGADNDGDTFVDFPNDPDCRSVVDDREEREGIVARTVEAVVDTTTIAARAVANTTATVAKATANTAERASVVVQERVLDNRTVEVANERVIAPTVVVAVAANAATATAATGFQIMTYLQQLLGLLASPGRLFGRRKRRAWGTVYASVSKRPLDLVTVRLVDATTKKVVHTEVTDHLGRFSFVVKRAGTYRIEVQRQGYVFPSATLKGRKEDTAFVDLYHGDAFNVTDAGAVITPNIPLDPRAEGKEEPDAKTIRRHYTRIVSAGVSASGLVLS